VPAAIPFTTPVVLLIVAMVVSLLLHVPPDVAFVKAVVVPTHVPELPAIAATRLLTVVVT
jgi:hypothetical protein